MPIEFGCPECQRPVRVADAAAGKKGKCPHCGAVMVIPSASQPAGTSHLRPRQPAGQPATVSFPCPGCGRTMNAPDALTDKKGKCPHCQTVFVVGGSAPSAATQALAPQPTSDDLQPLGEDDLAPLDGRSATWSDPLAGTGGADDLFAGLPAAPQTAVKPLPGVNPLGYTPASSRFGDAAGAANPYASAAPISPSGYHGRPIVVPLKLMIPAIAMLLISAVTFGFCTFQAIRLAIAPLPPDFAAERGLRGDPETAVMTYKIGGITGSILTALINVGVFAGAVQMIRLRGWDTARGGAGAAIVPCCSMLCLNMPFGIWALIVLNQPDVKRLFQ